MHSNYQILLQKLDDFIRKYYRNEIVKGLILTSTVVLIAWISSSVIEYFGHYSVITRTAIFYSALVIFFVIFGKFIIYPVLQFFKIGKIINHEQASTIISKHFTNIQDKLINTLELGKIKEHNSFSQELLFASIEQRTKELTPLSFPRAINKKINIKYLRILFSVIVVIGILLISSPAVLTEGTVRIIKHNTYFEPKQPFHFELENKSLNVEKGQNFDIKVKIKGDYVPENAFIVIGGNNYLLSKQSNTEFNYKIKNINNSINFHFSADDVRSENFKINVLPSPGIIDFQAYINVPAYTNEKNKVLNNVGDLTIPEGSNIKWVFQTISTDELRLCFNDTIIKKADKEDDKLVYSDIFTKSTGYSVSLKNKFFNKKNIIRYNIHVVPDMYPGIRVNAFQDSSVQTIYYFKGNISDDYGLSKLYFKYHYKDDTDSIKSVAIPISQGITTEEFYYAFDFSNVKLTEGKSLEYYFEVWDNDGVHGSKFTKSDMYEYKMPSKEELEQMESEAEKSIEDKMKESKRLIAALKKDLNDLQKNMINRELSSWEKTKALQNISQKQNTLEQLLEQINNVNTEKNNYMNSYSEQKDELIEKQKQIEEMLKNLMDDEMKKMLDELNELMNDFDKKKLNNLTEKMNMSYEDLNKQLDKNLEILKKFEVEKNIENIIDKLNDLAEKQEELSNDTKNKKGDKENLTQRQKEQSEAFNKAMEDYKKALEKNKELENPMKLQDFEQDKENISKEFEQGNREMEKGNMKKASKSQQQNSENLKNMAASMEGMMQQNSLQQNSENMDDLRQIIENIVTFSFDQEGLMKKFDNTSLNDPNYMNLTTEQKKLEDNFIIIKDSLNALGKRTPMLGNMIDKEVKSIERDMAKTLNLLEETRTNNIHAAQSRQQMVMTSANNLALLLSEILQQMQQQSMCQCSGNGNCKKPGNGKPKLSDMKGQQQSLKQQLESLLQQLKEGNKPGNQNSANKQLAKMMAQQEIFQNELSKLMNSGGINPDMMRLLNEIKSLSEQVENDIINKNITPTTIKRQDQILTRLLEAENSDYQREIDNKRKSEEAKNKKLSNPKDFFKYKRLHQNYDELLNTSEIKMYKYYNEKYKQYLMNLNDN